MKIMCVCVCVCVNKCIQNVMQHRIPKNLIVNNSRHRNFKKKKKKSKQIKYAYRVLRLFIFIHIFVRKKNSKKIICLEIFGLREKNNSM